MKINYPILLDGGLSNQLEKQGLDLNHNLWSAILLETNPEAIIQAHLAYLKAGAQCIITSSYQASVDGFMSEGYDMEKAHRLIKSAVLLAEEAIKRHISTESPVQKPLIAASIGPYGGFLADGSEYTGDYGVSDETLRKFHKPQISLLDDTKADFFACETLPSFQETKVLATLLKTTKKPAWVSFSCRDGQHLNDGTHIGKCATLLASHPTVFAIGVNCTPPKYISGLIKTIKEEGWAKKIVMYPNSGEVYHAKSKAWRGVSDPQIFVEMAKEWIDLGADIIGGCCRIGPEHIKNMNEFISGSHGLRT